MILRKLQLKNIRSYKAAEVEIPLGKTLFEGDIGAGKSTILMAIEFAFFGLGSESGSALLRLGAQRGDVRVSFEVDGVEYEIHRTLVRKGARVQQAEGVLKSGDSDANLSPSEMKEKVLDILQFREASDPKAQSWIYRYAVYTPQEDMKSVLLLAPSDRLQILRRAFGIEDYKTAAENATELIGELRTRKARFEAFAVGAKELEQKVRQLKNEREKLLSRVTELTDEEKGRELRLQELTAERKKLHGDEVTLSGIVRELAMNRDLRLKLDEEVSRSMKESEDIRAKLKKLERKVTELSRMSDPTDVTQERIRNELQDLERKREKLTVLTTRVGDKLEEYRSILENGVCPVCDRPVESKDFGESEKTKAAELEHLKVEADECERSLRRKKELLEKKQEFDSAMGKLVDYEEEGATLNDELTRADERVSAAREELFALAVKIRETQTAVDGLGEVSRKLEDFESRIGVAERGLRAAREELAVAKTRSTDLVKELGERENEIESKSEYAKRVDSMKEREIWMQDFFVPTLEAIEQHVLTAINQEFNVNFQKWFSVLVDDPEKEVRVDENFTPIVSQEGYEQEIYYLSGGEKTSVSLAYRLALNTLVQRVSTGMKSNILILDEPTDGFSKEQLGSVQEVLDDVECPQMIIVSHEKELESFADQIFRVTKSRGESSISAGT
ncbi:MAG: SMC family ATPase [Thaumarchaeota archaeon]|nr:SMC family ATPase [Nitrososphaerota archaeon]